MIITGNVFEEMYKFKDFEFDILLCDPPYNLASKYSIDKEGHYIINGSKNDFMGEWENIDGRKWDCFFKQSFRILKYGSPIIMFSICRTQDILTYYARKNGFDVVQSLYWVFISSFPKASDAGKMLDKRAGVEREVVGQDEDFIRRNPKQNNHGVYDSGLKGGREAGNITAPATELSKKYDGYKYSISPLKQCAETILVFRKPVRESPISDLIAYESGDKEVYVTCVNIDGTRVPLKNENDVFDRRRYSNEDIMGSMKGKDKTSDFTVDKDIQNGRYTPQLIIQEEVAESMDEMSLAMGMHGAGKARGGAGKISENWSSMIGIGNVEQNGMRFGDDGGDGMSKVFPKIKYYDDIDVPYYYCPKVNKKERSLFDSFLSFDIVRLICNDKNIIQKEKLAVVDMEQLVQKDIEDCGIENKNDIDLNIISYGKNILEKFLKECSSIIKTKINLITTSEILNYLMQFLIKENIKIVDLKTEFGITNATSVNDIYPNHIIITMENIKTEHDVNNVQSKLLLLINVNVIKENGHCCVKPIQLITWLLKLFCAPDKEKINVLVPFSGSGSELVACELTGVKYKGIEINPEYVKIAESRLEKAKKEPEKFLGLFKKKEIELKKEEKPSTRSLF